MKNNKNGFTLVELMVVVIIVAILAAVSIPLMIGNVARAKATEAESALGTIRAAMRAYYAEHDTYVVTGKAVSYLAAGNIPGIRARAGDPVVPGDLDGTYFSQECYKITAASATDFTATCTWSASVKTGNITPRAADVNTATNTTTVDSFGNITRTGY